MHLHVGVDAVVRNISGKRDWMVELSSDSELSTCSWSVVCGLWSVDSESLSELSVSLEVSLEESLEDSLVYLRDLSELVLVNGESAV